jgi:hypothetical protein
MLLAYRCGYIQTMFSLTLKIKDAPPPPPAPPASQGVKVLLSESLASQIFITESGTYNGQRERVVKKFSLNYYCIYQMLSYDINL